MKIQPTSPALSRRGSKLLVELVIGVIGLLGIMLAQVVEPDLNATLQKLQAKKELASLELSQQPVQIDWLDILF